MNYNVKPTHMLKAPYLKKIFTHDVLRMGMAFTAHSAAVKPIVLYSKILARENNSPGICF